MKSRIIYTHLWQSEAWVNLSETAQRLVLYLSTNRTIGLLPVYKISDREICFDISCKGKSVDLADLDALKKEIESVGVYFYKGYYIFLNDYAQYHYIGGKTDSAKRREFSQLPNELQSLINEELTIEQLLGNDSPTIAPINHKSETINNKTYNINQNTVDTPMIEQSNDEVRNGESLRKYMETKVFRRVETNE